MLVVHFVGIVHTSPIPVDGLTGIDNLGEELDVLLLLLSDHDGIPQMEMHQDHDFTFTGLENSVFNVGIHDVDHLASGRNESETVGVGLQVALRLAAGEDRPHGEIGETGNAFILSANQFVLLHQVCLLLNLKFLLPGTLTELRDLAEGLRNSIVGGGSETRSPNVRHSPLSNSDYPNCGRSSRV